MPTCKFCNQEKPLIKAHIIPEAFFNDMRDKKTVPLSIVSTSSPPKKVIRVYMIRLFSAKSVKMVFLILINMQLNFLEMI